jgi:hypothetical protein
MEQEVERVVTREGKTKYYNRVIESSNIIESSDDDDDSLDADSRIDSDEEE